MKSTLSYFAMQDCGPVCKANILHVIPDMQQGVCFDARLALMGV